MSYHNSSQNRNTYDDHDFENTIADAMEHLAQSNIRIRSPNRMVKGKNLRKFSESEHDDL